MREELDDYRRFLTLSRLATERRNVHAAEVAQERIATRLGALHLDRRDHDSLFPPEDLSGFRLKTDDTIEALRK
jgi:hypothetical protein